MVKNDPFWTSVKQPLSHFRQVILNLSVVTRSCTFWPSLGWHFWLVFFTSQHNNQMIFWLVKHHWLDKCHVTFKQWPPKLSHMAFKHWPFKLCHVAYKHLPSKLCHMAFKHWPSKLCHMAFKTLVIRLCHMAFKHWPLGYAMIELKQLMLSLKLNTYS